MVRCAHHVAQAAQNPFFGIGVDAGKRVVQNQNLGSRNDRACQRGALLLAAGKRDAAFADHRFVPLRESSISPAMHAISAASRIRRLRPLGDAEGDVFAQRFAEKKSVLRNIADRAGGALPSG